MLCTFLWEKNVRHSWFFNRWGCRDYSIVNDQSWLEHDGHKHFCELSSVLHTVLRNHCLELSWWRSVWLIDYSGFSFFYKNSVANNTVFSLCHSPPKNLILIFLPWFPTGFLADAGFICVDSLLLAPLIAVNTFFFFFNTEGCTMHSPLLLEWISNSLSALPHGNDNKSSQ